MTVDAAMGTAVWCTSCSTVDVDAELVDVLPVAVEASIAIGAAIPACTDTDTLVVLGPFNKRKTEFRTKYEAIDAY